MQETHSTKSFEKYWLSEWGFKILFSHGSSDSRGTCILFKSNFDLEIVKYITDSNGRFVIADIIADNKKFTLVNLYAPNEDKPEFLDEIFDTLKEFECESIIIGGDFNCILSSDVDKQGGRLDSKPNSRARLLSYIENYDLSDIWRNLNSNTRRYTWHSANGKIQCRLDYFLIFQSLNGFVNNAEIAPAFKTDHSLVQLSLIKGNQPRGKGFWKFNSSLLSDLDYGNAKETIEQNLHALLLWDFLFKVPNRRENYFVFIFEIKAKKKAGKQSRKTLGTIPNCGKKNVG